MAMGVDCEKCGHGLAHGHGSECPWCRAEAAELRVAWLQQALEDAAVKVRNELITCPTYIAVTETDSGGLRKAGPRAILVPTAIKAAYRALRPTDA
jgi:hypothetical protein